MTIDWSNFTPYSALAGGLLIGLAAACLWLFSGRVAGISGIAGGIVRSFLQRPRFGDYAWRLAFVVGLSLAPLVFPYFEALPESRIDASQGMLAAAGLLVGFGTRLGSGCTSGHGVCGLGRLSLRSLAAVATFMLTAGLTVFVLRHVLA